MNQKQSRICYILRAYPGAGKSYLAKEIQKNNENTEIVSADNYWLDSSGNYNFNVEKLSDAHKDCFDKFKKCVNSGTNVIVDNTNLKYTDIKKYVDYLLVNNNLNNYIYSVKFISVSYNDLTTAISLRKNRSDGKNIPEDRIRNMYNQFLQDVRPNLLNDFKGKIGLNDLDELENKLPWNEDVSKTPAIIVDLDGTLAIFEYTNGMRLRSPYDASKSNEDIICHPVAEALRGFYNLGYQIIFVSGREDKFKDPTLEFLDRVCEEYYLNYSNLYMRKSGDFRKDTIVKEEIYRNLIEPNYSIIAVFDDRNSVTKMFRDLGLYVFNCNYRGIDF